MKPGPINRLVQELKRRRVFRGIVVYGASTFVLLEAANNIANLFGHDAAPPWVLWVLGIGFLGSLWFSWIYDITPGGIKKTDPDSNKKVPIPKKEAGAYQITTFISILIIIGLVTYNIVDGINKKMIERLDKSIAVLPYFNVEMSRKEIRDFEFIGHQITSCLTKVKDYTVIPWEDTRKYSRIGKDYNKMGNDLKAAMLVNWEPWETDVDKHLSVDLISVSEGLLWSRNYEIKGNWPAETIKHSRRISRKITRKLRTYLTPDERAILSEEPVSARATMYASLGNAMTQDTWERLTTGDIIEDTLQSEYIDSVSFEKAIAFFTDAIKEDPNYAEAYANRAVAKLWGYRVGLFDSGELEKCEEDIRKAFDLSPDLPEAHVAMGFYYFFGLDEYELALVSFEKAVELRPTDANHLYFLSLIWRRLGNWDNVKFYTDKVFEVNPRNVVFLNNMGISYLYVGDFARSIECQERAIELKPYWYAPYINKINALLATGDINESQNVLKEAEERTGQPFHRIQAELDLYNGNFPSAIGNIELAQADEYMKYGESEGDIALLKAKIYRFAGNSMKAQENYRSAADYFNNLIRFYPEYYLGHSQLGIAYAGLNMDHQAIEHAEKALELVNQAGDGIMIPFVLEDLIQVYVMTENNASAKNKIEDLLNLTSPFSLEYLQLDLDLKHLF